jgi:hypothetical protein
MNTHVVSYCGTGIWVDKERKMWSQKEDISCDIRAVRHYKHAGDQDQFLNDRDDLKFMVKYGSMKIESVIEVPEPPTQVPPPPPPPQEEPPKEPEIPQEEPPKEPEAPKQGPPKSGTRITGK